MRDGGYQLPFFKREPYRLTFIDKRRGEEFIKSTNIDDEKMTVLCLCKAGFGSVEYLESLDTDDFLDLVEFEEISRAIEFHVLNRG